MERISRNQLYISIADLISKRGTCGRLQVGAVITRNHRIVATGYNGPVKDGAHCKGYCNIETSCTRAIHAEANAIYFAAAEGVSLKGCDIYCTHSPCIKCAEAIISSGIRNLYYLHNFRDRSGIDFIKNNSKINISQLTYGQE